MKINSVEQLLESIFMVDESDLLEVDGWLENTKLMEKLLRNIFNTFTVEVEKYSQSESPIYVQVAKLEDGGLQLEAVSNIYCSPPLSMDAINSLSELGWEDPRPEENLPNFFIIVEDENIDYRRLAELLTRTLRIGYGVASADFLRITPRTMRIFQKPIDPNSDKS